MYQTIIDKMENNYLRQQYLSRSVFSSRILLIVMLVLLLFDGSCVQTEVKENGSGEPCFTKESLETVPWIVDELKQFQVPKSGGYNVSVRFFRGQQYLVVVNPFLSSPLAHVFDCAGNHGGDLGIGYEFFDEAELLTVLANVENYY
jgi:hypothetical protein